MAWRDWEIVFVSFSCKQTSPAFTMYCDGACRLWRHLPHVTWWCTDLVDGWTFVQQMQEFRYTCIPAGLAFPHCHECACSLTEISIKAVTVLPANNLRSPRHTEREKIRQKVNVSSLKFLQVSRSKYVYPQFLGNYIIHRLGRGSRGVGEGVRWRQWTMIKYKRG